MPQVIRSTIPQLHVTVNGKPLPNDAYQDILEGVIESSLHLPDACTLRIHDHGFKWLDSEHWKEGNEVKITAGQGRDPLVTIFEGEVTTLEMDLAAMGVATLTVRCMDKAHRLHRGRNRHTYTKVKDSDIVRTIASRNGLRVDGGTKTDERGEPKSRVKVDNTDVVHDWVIQNNQTDWEFLQFLAQRNGYRVYLQEKDLLCFRKVEFKETKPLDLEWGKELRSFRIRVSSSNQVNKVVVRSWDPKQKKSIIGMASTAKGTSEIQKRADGGKTAQQAFGQAEMVVVDRPVRSQKEAEQMAQSVCDDIGSSFVEADGLCFNQPQLSPGDRVKLKNIGERFNGIYIVTTTTHTFSAAEGFSTQFVISGKEPATLMSILGGGGGGGGGGAKTASKGSPNAGQIVIGIVTDNKDPLNQARVKVKFPALADNLATDWIRVATPMAGKARGFMFLPEVDDEVLVAFENGDAHHGYVIGCLWNGVDNPPMMTDYAVEDGKVRRRRLKTRYGHTMEFDDNGMIIFRTANGQVFEMEDGRGMRLSTATGQQIYLTNQGGVVMKTNGGKMIHATDPGGGVQLYDEVGNMVDLDSQKLSITIKAATNVNIIGGASVAVKGTGPVSIEGAMVNINSGGMAQESQKKTNDDALKDKGTHKLKLPGVDK